MAKWNLDTIEAEMENIQAMVDKLQTDLDAMTALAQKTHANNEALREQLRQAQQALRSARDRALEEAAQLCERGGVPLSNIRAIRSLKSTTQGSRE